MEPAKEGQVMKPLTILLADDEEPARLRLRRMLEKHAEQVVLVGQAEDGQQALQMCRELSPQVLFLDVQMPSMSGLEVAAELAELPQPPKVVFLTAFAEHAVKAFELKALDYLVKPVSADRLRATIERLAQESSDEEDWKESASQSLQGLVPTGPALERVALLEEVTENRLIVPVEKVDLFFSREEKGYARHGGKEYALQSTLARLEASLPKQTFFRCHRCFIINVTRVSKMVPWFNGAYNLVLPDGYEVPLTRRKVLAFKELVPFL
jgi:two-component system response regulator LytT